MSLFDDYQREKEIDIYKKFKQALIHTTSEESVEIKMNGSVEYVTLQNGNRQQWDCTLMPFLASNVKDVDIKFKELLHELKHNAYKSSLKGTVYPLTASITISTHDNISHSFYHVHIVSSDSDGIKFVNVTRHEIDDLL